MSNAHPFKTTRRAGSPSAGGNALSMETHISSTTAHPQYQKKGDTSQSIDLSAHTDARGAEDHASYYLRVSELETDYSSYEANDIQSIDILNAATRPGNPKKCVVTTILLKDVLRQHDASAELKFVKNTKVAVSVVGDATSPTITYWASGEAPSVVGIEAFVSLYGQIKSNRDDINAILLTNSASLADGNPLKGKVADYNHTHSLDDIDRNGLISSIQSSVNTILSDYVTRDMLKENGGWELALSEAGIYPESNDGTKTTTEIVDVDGVSTEVSHVEVINLNQRTRQGHSIYKVATEDGLTGIPSEIAALRAETANLEISDSNLIVDVQVTENTMHEADADIVSDPGETTRAVTQRLVTSTDGVVAAGYVAESIHDNRAQTFFRTGHAYGYSGYIGTIASLVGTSPKGLVEMTNDEVVDAFYDINNSEYTFGYFRATYAEKLRWSGVAGELFVPVKVSAFTAGVTYFEVNIDNEYVATGDTTPDANKQYFIKASNKGYSVRLGTAPSEPSELAVYNKLFGITDNKSLTNDVSSYLCGRFSTYSEVTDLIVDDPATGDVVEVDPRIAGADLVTDAIGSAYILEKLFDKSTAELGAGSAIPRENDKVVDGSYVVEESNAIFRKGLFIKTSDTSVIAGKKYYSKDLSGDIYSEVLDLVAGSTLAEGEYYEVITLEDVFNARNATKELTTTGSVNVKTLIDPAAAKIVYDYDEQGRLIVWGPWDQLATKHYVDKKLENVSVEGGTTGFGGGVIDGTMLLEFMLDAKTDWANAASAYGIELVTRDLPITRNGAETSEIVTVRCAKYTVQNDCLLNIRMQDVSFPEYGGGRITVDIVGDDGGLRCFGEFFEFLTGPDERKVVSVPVKAGTEFVISCHGMMYTLLEGSRSALAEVTVCMPLDITKLSAGNIAIREFRLNSLNVTVGLPNYDKGEDIKSKVVRTVLNTPKGYKAPSDGFVLFDFIVPLYTDPYQVSWSTSATAYVNGIRVFAARTDYKNGSYNQDAGLIPVRKGDSIDWSITSNNGTSTWIQDVSSWSEVKCTFFPLVGTGESSTGPIEYAVTECPFTLTGTTNPFFPGSSMPSLDKRTLDAGSIKSRTGRDVNVKEATIKFRMDVFHPKYNADGSITIDANGFTVPDDSKPMFSNDACGYYVASSNSFYSKPFEIVEINGKPIVKWNVQTYSQVYLPSLLVINPSSGSLPVVDYSATEGNGTNNNFNYNNLQAKAASLGLSNYYIRLTAVIDPNRKNIIESKSGMFVTGDIAKDENGNACRTLVPYTEWAAKQDSDGKYVYEYTVKTDCWLYANVWLDTYLAAYDEVTIKINGEVLDTYTDTQRSSQVTEAMENISLPVKRGTKISFHSFRKPATNQENNGSSNLETFAIKILEFKMGTELNPAQFPSLAIRVLDADLTSTEDAVLFGKTYTWTETELKQVYGPMFSLSEANIDFTGSFYIAPSAEGYDDASKKITDVNISMQNSVAYHKFPVTFGKDATGETVLSVHIPGTGGILTTAYWTGSDYATNTSVSDVASAIGLNGRMRLLMHISDRRGEIDTKLPNGISSFSQMIKVGEMNLSAANNVGNVSYTNELTIPESGICVIRSNFDSDVSGDDFRIVAVQALMGGNWETIQTAPVHTVADGRGTQGFNFQVEAGTKIRLATDVGMSDAAGSISGTRSELDSVFTHAHQGVCWIIPTSRYQNPERTLPGSAGVIDGSIWKDKDGNELITEVTDGNTRTSCTYYVKNDCFLCIKTYSGDIGNTAGNVCIDVFVNGTNMGSMLADVNQDGAGVDNQSIGLPVAEGSVVELKSSNGTSNLMATAAGRISFTEFKLRATNVLAAMPDWDESKAVKLGNGSVIEADGWIVFRVDDTTMMDNNYQARSYINGVEVYYWGGELSDGDNNTNTVNVPVCKGDVLTHTDVSGRMSCTFYPVKMTRAEYPDKVIVPNWSGDGTAIASGGSVPSDGWVILRPSCPTGSSVTAYVNGISIGSGFKTDSSGSDPQDRQPTVIPVAKNDVVSYAGSGGASISFTFYPAKPATTTTSEADVLEEKINKNAADIAANSSEIETLKSTLSSMDNTAAILSAVYPVGSVYITVSNALPAAIAAIGTWTQMATGRTLWNVAPADAKLGQNIAAGLPSVPEHSHTIYTASNQYGAGGGSYHRGISDAGSSTQEFQTGSATVPTDDIYGASDTVQPPAIGVTMWQRTA